jgi:hypothetical protein
VMSSTAVAYFLGEKSKRRINISPAFDADFAAQGYYLTASGNPVFGLANDKLQYRDDTLMDEDWVKFGDEWFEFVVDPAPMEVSLDETSEPVMEVDDESFEVSAGNAEEQVDLERAEFHVLYRRIEMDVGPYLPTHHSLDDAMRAKLLLALIDAHLKMKMRPETLFLSINIIDRYFAAEGEHLSDEAKRLVTVTALFIAYKVEEVDQPMLKSYLSLMNAEQFSDNIKVLEVRIFNTIGFRLNVGTVFSYVDYYCQAAHSDSKQCHLVSYLLELALIKNDALTYPPSKLCAAALLLALTLMGTPEWTTALYKRTWYKEQDLQKAKAFLQKVHYEAQNEVEHAIGAKGAPSVWVFLFKKYCDAGYEKVALIPALLPF